ncbi:tetratricopeptide repeat protein [Acetobacter conturbans]|uniref:Sel1 repeat family protein n=1 Tax=Acetobacter conturbans TaxID=1737472 RepID=A0ABX0JYA2_9PROT|nr:tetratricopeptide repeat protein [Acetobacter conturbans]NHN88349.1 sel1 repeat family protein [Acetobacter conturbans]
MSDAVRSTSALLALGQICLNHGDGERAFSLFEAAARSGSPQALNMVGRSFEQGWGVKRDPVSAASCFRQAAEDGDGWAVFNLADLYIRGEGVVKDPVLAYGLYVEAARRGVGKALNMLGVLHEDGCVGEPDIPGARLFFLAASDAGDCWGALNVGRLWLAEGEAGQAASWFERALSLGFSDVFQAVITLLEKLPADPKLLSVLARARTLLRPPPGNGAS